MSYAKCRTITFILSEQINVDQLAEKVNFNLKREYRTGTGDDSVMNQDINRLNTLSGKIRYEWLNYSFDTYKLKCKTLLLT